MSAAAGGIRNQIDPELTDEAPLTDLDALYGVHGPHVVLPAPALDAPPADLVDDIPAMVASAWANPPLDAK